MTWFKILKESKIEQTRRIRRAANIARKNPGQTTLDVGPKIAEHPKGMPEEMQGRPTFGRKTISPSSRKTAEPRREPIDEDVSTGDDTRANIKEVRARLMRESRGQYGELADAVTLLATRAREEPREQKRLLGKIRRMIRKKNIPEVR